MYLTWQSSQNTLINKWFYCSLQPHAETRAKQISAWRNLLLEYCKASKKCVIDIREASALSVFNNTAINRKLDPSFITAILSDLQRTGNASPLDKHKNRWEIYWHTLEEWGSLIQSYVISKGFTNTVLTLFELAQGDDTQGEEFYGLDNAVLIKALRVLESQGKCELILEDEHEGVKFF